VVSRVRGLVGPILGSAVFFCLAPAVVAGIVPGLLAGWHIRPAFLGLSALRVVGVVLMVAGGLSLLDSFARFALQGRGTPAPIAPTATLVVSGQYRYVRNPMYIAVVTTILGQALLFGSTRVLGYGASVWCAFHVFVLAYEEPTLRGQFGQAYAAYQAGVRRWWPRVTPWTADRPGRNGHGAAEQADATGKARL
jgi:protein-S-isoprenylcysteine O-methyltransferase Ste14